MSEAPRRRPGRPATGVAPQYAFRAPADLRTAFIDKVGGSRKAPAMLRQFMRWYVGEPGATLPKRPSEDTAEKEAA